MIFFGAAVVEGGSVVEVIRTDVWSNVAVDVSACTNVVDGALVAERFSVVGVDNVDTPEVVDIIDVVTSAVLVLKVDSTPVGEVTTSIVWLFIAVVVSTGLNWVDAVVVDVAIFPVVGADAVEADLLVPENVFVVVSVAAAIVVWSKVVVAPSVVVLSFDVFCTDVDEGNVRVFDVVNWVAVVSLVKNVFVDACGSFVVTE